MPTSRRRFHVPRAHFHEGTALLPDGQLHHLRDVLRLRAGDEVEVFDGEGRSYCGTIRFVGSRVSIDGLRPIESASKVSTPLILAFALIKADKFEWVLQKGTELGVYEFIPLRTRFCEIKIPEKKIEPRLERWNRIVAEATRQCGACSVPKIRKPLDFSGLLKLEDFAAEAKFLFCERASERWHEEISQAASILLCIGPEGGWHADEIEAARLAGFQLSSLGQRILRAETAAIAAVALIQHHLGVI